MPANWESAWGFLTETQPVIVTEFGDLNAQCTGDYNQQVIAFADLHHASWTAWAWFVKGCDFPSIIADWQGTPSVQGVPVKTALMGYQDPPAASTADAGADAPDGSSDPDAGAPPDDAGSDTADAASD